MDGNIFFLAFFVALACVGALINEAYTRGKTEGFSAGHEAGYNEAIAEQAERIDAALKTLKGEGQTNINLVKFKK